MKPFLLVTQFHGVNEKCVTFSEGVITNVVVTVQEWTSILFKCVDALSFLHSKHILHNDIKGDNVIISKINDHFSPIIIDFGKAVDMAKAKVYQLPAKDQEKYRKEHKQIAPELVRGTHKQSTASDVYSFGLLISLVCKYYLCEPLRKLAFQCIHCNPSKRPQIVHLKNEFNKITYM